MRIVALVVLLLVGLAGCCCKAEAADASTAWNELAASYNFQTVPTSPNVTFLQGYSGSDFTNDFADIMARVGEAMSASYPDPDGDEVMNTAIQNWPSP